MSDQAIENEVIHRENYRGAEITVEIETVIRYEVWTTLPDGERTVVGNTMRNKRDALNRGIFIARHFRDRELDDPIGG